ADQRRREKEDREDRIQAQLYDREDGDKARQDRSRQLEMNLEMLKELAKHGHTDMLNLNVERLIAEVSGVPYLEVKGSGLPAALPIEGSADNALDSETDDDDEQDAPLREEDDD
ncbi:hypothetical protein AB0M43_38140, partial [Longispora sp. NPDC051575]|uniref:hypothetical protein n=1 Tax=Longispora sp. NPDC051575 TaxID=3154943 RepID=UPI003435E4F5